MPNNPATGTRQDRTTTDARRQMSARRQAEQHNAELAVVNSIQQALARQLDLQAVIDLVGEKLRDVFSADVVIVGLLDAENGAIAYPFVADHGERFHPAPLPDGLRAGVGGYAMRMREPVVVHTEAELDELVARLAIDTKPIGGETQDQSFVYVPLLIDDSPIGVICIGKQAPHAFDDAAVKLIVTMAASLSLALQNARSFQAEKQRNAELALINTVQRGLAGQLSLQEVYDAVGMKLREVFPEFGVGIRRYDPTTDLMHFPFWWQEAERAVGVAPERPGGYGAEVLRTGRSLLVDHDAEAVAHRLGSKPAFAGGKLPKSQLVVPMFAGGQAIGMLDLNHLDREHAFSDSDVRLLETLAASMSVALENARLFDETQRLLKETEQRNAELAVINSIQQGLASKLELQAVIDLVGNKMLEVFETNALRVDLLDREHGLLTIPFFVDGGERFQVPPRPLATDNTVAGHVLRTRQPLVFGTEGELETLRQRLGIPRAVVGADETDQSLAYVPLLIDDDAIGVIVIGKREAHAFDEAAVKLITTVAASLSLALQNAHSFEAERQRVAELGVIASIQQAVSAQLDFQGIVDVVGDKLREVFATGDLSIWWLDEPGGATRSLYSYEHGVRDAARSFTPRPGGAADRLLSGRETLLMRSQDEQMAIGFPVMEGTDRARSIVAVPMVAGERTWGAVFLENHERDDAFDASRVRLVETITASMTVALLNARSYEAERQRGGRAGGDQQHPAGNVGLARFPGHRRARRRPVARGAVCAGHGRVVVRPRCQDGAPPL